MHVTIFLVFKSKLRSYMGIFLEFSITTGCAIWTFGISTLNNSVVFQPILINEHESETSFGTILTMSQYTPKERAEIVAFYIENNRSYSASSRNTLCRKMAIWSGLLDLTVPDFFLWGYLKSKVNASKPKTIDELKCNIRAKIAAITPEMLANVMQNARKELLFVYRMEVVI